MTYVALTRMKDDMARDWDVFGEGPLAMDAAKMLRDQMRAVGFRDSEMHDHCKDLVEGYTLTADNGRQFKVEQKPLGREVVYGPGAVKDPLLDLLTGDPWGAKADR